MDADNLRQVENQIIDTEVSDDVFRLKMSFNKVVNDY